MATPSVIQPFGHFVKNEDATPLFFYAKVRFKLERAGTPVGPMDLLIASIGLAHNFMVVTNNEKEFKRIVGLRIENWL